MIYVPNIVFLYVIEKDFSQSPTKECNCEIVIAIIV